MPPTFVVCHPLCWNRPSDLCSLDLCLTQVCGHWRSLLWTLACLFTLIYTIGWSISFATSCDIVCSVILIYLFKVHGDWVSVWDCVISFLWPLFFCGLWNLKLFVFGESFFMCCNRHQARSTWFVCWMLVKFLSAPYAMVYLIVCIFFDLCGFFWCINFYRDSVKLLLSYH